MTEMSTSGATTATKKDKLGPKLYVTIHVSLPGPMRGFKDVDPSSLDLRTAFSRLEAEHRCKIGVEANGASIMIKATNRSTTKEVFTSIRELLLYRPGEENVWRTQILVHPPRDGKEHFAASLRPREGGRGVRPIAMELQDLERAQTKDIAAAELEYKQDLARVLDTTGRVLRHDPSALRMRVRFGTITLDEWKRGKSDYTFAELGDFLRRAGTRGTARMTDAVGKDAVEALKARLSGASEDLPESVARHLDPSMKPSYSLILETKNLQVETSLELVQAQGTLRGKVKQREQYSLGPLSAHQREKRERSVEILTACPESHHDWVLEVRKVANRSDDSASVPFTARDLERQLSFPGDSLGGDFPNISIVPAFIRKHQISKVYGKATWSYTLSLRYSLEISVFHEWDGNTQVPPTSVARVTLYSYDWDDDMAVAQPRGWDESFATQFLKPYAGDEKGPAEPGWTGDSLDHFLSWIHWIQKILDDGVKAAGR